MKQNKPPNEIIEQAKTWFNQDAPGIDRTDSLQPPALPPLQPNIRPEKPRFYYTRPRLALQTAAACAIFAIGYLLGTATTPLPDPAVRPTQPIALTAKPLPKEVTKPPRITHTTDKDGRLYIEPPYPAVAPAPCGS